MRTSLAMPRGLGSRPLGPRTRALGRAPARVVCQAGTEPPQDTQEVQPVQPLHQQPMMPPLPYEGAPPGMPMDPRYYQVPGAPPGVRTPQEYYMAPPPAGYYPPYAYHQPPPAVEAAQSGGAPWWLWVGVGVVVANVINKVQEYMKNPKTPQQMMAEMAMKQMMGAMGNGAPGATPPPFGGKPGAMPPFGAQASPFAGFNAAAAAGAAAPSAATVDVAAGSSDSSRKGDKFSARMSGETARAPEAPKADAAPTSKPLDVVEPEVKEPTSRPSSSSTSSSSSSARSSFFTDVSSDSARAASSSGGGGGGGSANGAGGSGADGAVMSEMMENMLRNPEMQKMLYPYLPEPMRNPQSIEFMLNNPEVKKQMATLFEGQNAMSPQMMEMMKGMDFNQDKVNQQFAELGLKPEDVISKVMQNPELAAGFSNPKVQAAIMDISTNPMNIMKYQSDPEVMKVLEKVTEIFQPNMPPGAR